jgi:hypothetical protein
MADSFKTAGRAAGEMRCMTKTPDLNAAARFMAETGRVLDQRRFQLFFRGGASTPVRDAVAAYRNPDGGFGNTLEPDLRCPLSQPAPTEMALRLLDEAAAWDAGLVQDACDWLQRNEAVGGGATMVEANVTDWPRAPWWVPEGGRPASLIQTGLIAGVLHSRGETNPWLARATEVMWERIGGLSEPGPYEMFGVLKFLECVPDRARAQRAFDVVGPMLLDRKLVELDPDAPGEVHGVLSFAPNPESMARVLFDAAAVDAHLDKLAAGQQDDGGWTFNWPQWSAAAALDWRGFMTVEALTVLRANDRL